MRGRKTRESGLARANSGPHAVGGEGRRSEVRVELHGSSCRRPTPDLAPAGAQHQSPAQTECRRQLPVGLLEILQRVAAGEASIDIANELGMSRHTLRTHIQNVLTKLGVHSKTDAVVAAIRFGKVRTNEKLSQTDVDAS